MRGGRMAPRVVRNAQFTSRQMRQSMFVRSATNMTREVRANMRELTGRQIREIRPASNPTPILPKSVAGQILENMADLLGDLAEQKQAREELSKLASSSSSAKREHYGIVAEGLGIPRDADGNAVHVDKHDRPFVYVRNGEIVYVKVYMARITPKGVNLDAKCTVENPDGKEEVLLVEPIPSLEAPPSNPFQGI